MTNNDGGPADPDSGDSSAADVQAPIDSSTDGGSTLDANPAEDGGVDSGRTLMGSSPFEGMTAALESRHHEVRFNVYRDIEVRDNDTGGNNGVSVINLWGGSYNVYDPIAMYYEADRDYPGEVIRDNRIVNSNFYGLSDLQEIAGPTTEVDNEFINCNFVGFYGDNEGTTTRYINSNFYDNAFPAPAGPGVIEAEVSFMNPASGDFSLSERTPASIYNGGADNPYSRYGFEGTERLSGMFAIGSCERD